MTLSLLPFWALAIAAAWLASRVIWDRRPFALLLTLLLAAAFARWALVWFEAPYAFGRAIYVGQYAAVCSYIVRRVSSVRTGPLMGVWTLAALLAVGSPVQPWGVYWASRILVIGVPLACRRLAPLPGPLPSDCGILWAWWGVSDLVTGIQRDSIPTQYAALTALAALEVYRAWSAHRGTQSPA